jgi:hypothetical protein
LAEPGQSAALQFETRFLQRGSRRCVIFVPARKISDILLANKRHSIDTRVTLSHEILTQLADRAPIE